jgi:hypothetical protein
MAAIIFLATKPHLCAFHMKLMILRVNGLTHFKPYA